MEKSDYLGIGLTVLNQLAYSIKIMDIRDGEPCSERVKTKVETVLQYATIELGSENVRVLTENLENGSKDFSDIAYTVGGL